MSNNIPQMRSTEYQPPFFFGGSQIPSALGLKKGSYSGSGFTGSEPTKYPKFREGDGKRVYYTR